MNEKFFLRIKSFPVIFYVIILFPMAAAGVGAEPPGESVVGQEQGIRPVFLIDDADWKTLASTDDPVKMPQGLLLQIMHRLRQRLIEDLLWGKTNLTFSPFNKDRQEELSEEIPKLLQGDVVDFSDGVVVRKVTPHAVDVRRDGLKIDRYFVCELTLADRVDAVCVTPRIPPEWLTRSSTKDDDSMEFDPPERTGFLGLVVSPGKKPVFVASRSAFFPETLLGRFGMDVSLLEAVKPIPVRVLKAKKATPSELRVLKFTDLDFEPFYRMLLVASTIPPAALDAETAKIKKEEAFVDKQKNPSPVFDFFNHPETQQGRFVRLSGYARKIERIAVEDMEALDRFSLDHYYQIAFFTETSQDNPIIVCLTDIPKGMPIGEGKSFNVPMTVSAFFYKVWAYEKVRASQAEALQENGTSARNSIQFAPLLIGARVDWYRVPEEDRMNDQAKDFHFSSVAVFLGFVLAWIVFRLVRPRSSRARFRLIPSKNGPVVCPEEQECAPQTERVD